MDWKKAFEDAKEITLDIAWARATRSYDNFEQWLATFPDNERRVAAVIGSLARWQCTVDGLIKGLPRWDICAGCAGHELEMWKCAKPDFHLNILASAPVCPISMCWVWMKHEDEYFIKNFHLMYDDLLREAAVLGIKPEELPPRTPAMTKKEVISG